MERDESHPVASTSDHSPKEEKVYYAAKGVSPLSLLPVDMLLLGVNVGTEQESLPGGRKQQMIHTLPVIVYCRLPPIFFKKNVGGLANPLTAHYLQCGHRSGCYYRVLHTFYCGTVTSG